jgi:hypothetical protein
VTVALNETNTSVTEIELKYGVSAGISLRSLGNDLVPLFEEHEARVERGYDIDGWYSLSSMERAFCVAQRRIRIAMKNLQSEAEIDKSKREANKGKQ